MGTRFTQLAEQIRAGVVPRAPRAASVTGEPKPARERQPKLLSDGTPDWLPAWPCQRRGWLALLAPAAASYSGWSQTSLADPEVMAMAMAAASPEMTRLLRSSCRMRAVDPGTLPSPRRKQPAVTPDEAKPGALDKAKLRRGAERSAPHLTNGINRPNTCRRFGVTARSAQNRGIM